MKIQTNQQRLLSVLFCSLSVILGFGSCIERTQGEILTKKPPQQGFGRAPNPNPTVTPNNTKKPPQQGFGRAPNPDPTATPTTNTEKPPQQGFGRAPNPNSTATPTTNTEKPPQQGFGRAQNPNSTKIYSKY